MTNICMPLLNFDEIKETGSIPYRFFFSASIDDGMALIMSIKTFEFVITTIASDVSGVGQHTDSVRFKFQNLNGDIMYDTGYIHLNSKYGSTSIFTLKNTKSLPYSLLADNYININNRPLGNNGGLYILQYQGRQSNQVCNRLCCIKEDFRKFTSTTDFNNNAFNNLYNSYPTLKDLNFTLDDFNLQLNKYSQDVFNFSFRDYGNPGNIGSGGYTWSLALAPFGSSTLPELSSFYTQDFLSTSPLGRLNNRPASFMFTTYLALKNQEKKTRNEKFIKFKYNRASFTYLTA